MNNRGVALPLVLWTITVLMAVVLSFALATRTETRMTSNFRASAVKKSLAQAGIERALLELRYRSQGSKTFEDMQPWRADDSEHTEELGKGHYTVSVMDDAGKISLNGLTDGNSVVLRNLLVRLGASSETADTIVDSILDWRDEDNLHRLNGAEDDYYMSLPVPYHARNGNFQTPEELLLVKGVTEEILFGKGATKGLISFVTVLSVHSGVNLESAPREILLSLPGMTEGLADGLIAYRESAPAWNAAEAQGILGAVYAQMIPYLNTISSKTYTLTSRGYTETDKAGYSITATVSLDGADFKYAYYKSPSGRGE